jgi:sigma-B regulation protein RsbU (phosphoserine phosphatase)
MFATVLFGVLDTVTGTLTNVNRGRKPAVLIDSTGTVKAPLDVTGPAMGIMPAAAYDINRIQLEPGDTLLAYTDGVTDARSPSEAFFTEERLLPILQAPTPRLNDLLGRVVVTLDEHAAGAEPFDDVTMLAVRRLS